MRDILKIMFRGIGLCCMSAMLLGIAAFPAVSFATQPGPGQRVFTSPEEARQALLNAVKQKDHGALRKIFGPVAGELEPGDPVVALPHRGERLLGAVRAFQFRHRQRSLNREPRTRNLTAGLCSYVRKYFSIFYIARRIFS